MKKSFFIASFMVVGLFLQVGTGFARNNSAEQGQAILNRIEREKGSSEAYPWITSGPTAEDIRATKVENLATKGSREDKLINAVKNGDLKNVEASIAAGAALEARDNEEKTALMIAATKGDADIVSQLIKAGANVNAKDKFHWTPLFMAIDKGHIDTVKILMAAGAICSDFKSVFLSAAYKGNTEIVKALMVNADIDCDTLNLAYMIALNRRRSNPELFNVIEEALSEARMA